MTRSVQRTTVLLDSNRRGLIVIDLCGLSALVCHWRRLVYACLRWGLIDALLRWRLIDAFLRRWLIVDFGRLGC